MGPIEGTLRGLRAVTSGRIFRERAGTAKCVSMTPYWPFEESMGARNLGLYLLHFSP